MIVTEQKGIFMRCYCSSCGNNLPMFEFECQHCVEQRATMQEQTVLDLWRKGLMPQRIADELDMDVDKVEDIIECEENYRRER